jgi:hypothetical protein
MNLHEKLNSVVFLYYIEYTNSKFLISFTYRKEHYFLWIKKKHFNIDKRTVEFEDSGASKYIGIIEEYCKNEIWDELKEKCFMVEKWYRKSQE